MFLAGHIHKVTHRLAGDQVAACPTVPVRLVGKQVAVGSPSERQLQGQVSRCWPTLAHVRLSPALVVPHWAL